MLWYKKPGNWVDKMLCSEVLAFFTDMKYWYFLVIVFVPWTAGWQMAAGIEPPNPANPLVVSPSEGWKRTHTSTRREEDKISQNSTKMDKGEKKHAKTERHYRIVLKEILVFTLILITLISTAISSAYRATKKVVMQNLRCLSPTWFSANFHSLMDLVMKANTQ